MEPAFTALALCDRAFQLLSQRDATSESELLAHVYGGSIPLALQQKLAAPLLGDTRLERRADGSWALRSHSSTAPQVATFTALAVVASGPSPRRASVVQVVALRVEGGAVTERFEALVKPPGRVPKYVLHRVGVEAEVLDAQPDFGNILDDLAGFLGTRPVLAQDARLAWAFLQAEARRLGRTLVEPELLDVNRLATGLLAYGRKPSLALIAGYLGISTVDVSRADEEARVLGLVGQRLSRLGTRPGAPALEPAALRRSSTAASLPDKPGVYVLRDAEQTPLYVGKARRLRERVGAYVHRPLGATRRLEGLVSAVEAVETTRCETDLEALVLEDREIRRLQPRFNTVRQQRSPRYWIRLPAQRVSVRGRALAPPKLVLSLAPEDGDGECIGPFRNEATAEATRRLAREVFELDASRQPAGYPERLAQAWQFLHGDTEAARTLARRSVALLRKVLAFEPGRLLLPADPRHARYAVVRPGPLGIEAFVLDHAVLHAWSLLEDEADVSGFVCRLLGQTKPRTMPEDADVVLRWFGAQRPSARLILLEHDALAASDAVEVAVLDLLEARAAGREDLLDPLV